MKQTCTQDAAVRLMLKFPFWSELYYSMSVTEDETIPTLATDGRNLFVNPKFWATLSLELKIAAIAHEVGHKMLLHVTRRGHRHPQLWNIAADFVVNAILVENGFKLGDDWLFDARFKGMSTEEVYRIIESEAQQNAQQQQGQGKGGKGQGAQGSGGQQGEEDGEEGDGDSDGAGEGGGTSGQGNSVTHPQVPASWAEKWQDIRDATQGQSKETIEKTEREFIDQVQKAVMTAKARGVAPGGMEAFDDVCKPSKEPWYNHLHRYMQSLSVAEYNWARINRRQLVQHQLFTPDHYSESLEHIVFAIDTSGSVFDAASQANFAGHINAILAEAKPKHIHVLYFDTRIARHDQLDYGQVEFNTRPAGGGGTSFPPIFEYIEAEGIQPEVCIVLTDCYGDYPKDEPAYPVLWACIEEMGPGGHYYPPFGEYLYVDPNL